MEARGRTFILKSSLVRNKGGRGRLTMKNWARCAPDSEDFCAFGGSPFFHFSTRPSSDRRHALRHPIPRPPRRFPGPHKASSAATRATPDPPLLSATKQTRAYATPAGSTPVFKGNKASNVRCSARCSCVGTSSSSHA